MACTFKEDRAVYMNSSQLFREQPHVVCLSPVTRLKKSPKKTQRMGTCSSTALSESGASSPEGLFNKTWPPSELVLFSSIKSVGWWVWFVGVCWVLLFVCLNHLFIVLKLYFQMTSYMRSALGVQTKSRPTTLDYFSERFTEHNPAYNHFSKAQVAHPCTGAL